MGPSTDRTTRVSPGWIPAVLTAVFVLAAAVFWFLHVPREREEVLAAWRGDLGLKADFRRAALDDFLRDSLADARLLAGFPSVRAVALAAASTPPRPPDAHASAHFEEVVTEFRQTYGYDLVAVFDRSSASTAGSPSPSSDAGCRAAARDVIESATPAASLHVHARGEPALTLAAPIRDGSGAPLGAVLVVTSPGSRLYPLLGEALTPRTGEAVLLGRQGDSAVYLSPLRYRRDMPLSLRRPLSTEGFAGRVALEQPAAEGVFVDYRGERVVAATRRLTVVPWALVLKVDESEALEPFRDHVRNVALGWGGALAAVLALAWGVGQRVRRLKAVADARSEARFRTLFEQASEAVFVVGADGRIQEANRAAEEMHGASRGELIGRHVTDLRPPEQRKAAHAAFAASEHVDRLVFEAEHIRADGARFPVEISMRRAEIPGGPVHVSIVRDIGARKRGGQGRNADTSEG